ncbi:MAG: DUF3147 family protein [Notoacmeibacter sp.]|nr:DUF3147 family protein [Notoacmeibacter sp.]MCC0032164.1 DUF3147 family protein [Brucellaceae bacterium]
MLWFLVKCAVSGVIIGLASEVSRRNPGFGALIASLPLISILTMIWIWRDTGNVIRIADHASATLWLVLPSLPMFALVPWMLRSGYGFWLSLASGSLLTILLYTAAVWLAERIGLSM